MKNVPFKYLALLFGVQLLTGLQAFSQNCGISELTGSTIRERSEAQARAYTEADQLALQIYESYLAGDAVDLKKNCSNSIYRDLLESSLHKTFKSETLKKLLVSGGNKAEFAKKIQNKTISPFRLTGHFREDSPTEKAGGFHRGHGSIFMNFTKIPPSEWEIYFIHEFAHSLDSELLKSITPFTNVELIQSFYTATKNNSWSQEQKRQLTSWLLHGLNRGFLAEYRAWTVTFALYQEGLQDGTFNKIQWMEDILSHQGPQESLRSFILRYLSPRFSDPQKGPFSSPQVQAELKKLRQELLTNPPPLGENFSDFHENGQR